MGVQWWCERKCIKEVRMMVNEEPLAELQRAGRGPGQAGGVEAALRELVGRLRREVAAHAGIAELALIQEELRRMREE